MKSAERRNQKAVADSAGAGQVEVEAGQAGRRQAAQAKAANHLPVDTALPVMDAHAKQLGNGGKPQIGTNGRGGGYAKQQDQYGSHQRAATDAGQPDKQSDEKAGGGVGEISQMHHA